MISYELAKELRNKGWKYKKPIPGLELAIPTTNRIIKNSPSGTVVSFGVGFNLKWWKMPTLSELIESCEDRFYCLYRSTYILGGTHDMIDGWGCNGGMSNGQTMEEAVANLWLQLNE